MATLLYDVLYGLSFPDAVSGAAAVAANGGNFSLGNMTPAAAVAAYPTGTITQVGPFVLFGLTGGAGAQPGAYASFTNTQGPPANFISYTPTDRILATDGLTTATETILPGGFGAGTTYTVQAEWLGAIIYPTSPAPPTAPTPAVPIAGKFQMQALQYTGNGAASRPIATAFDLSVGRVLIWVFPDNTFAPVVRSNDASMPGTYPIGSSNTYSTDGISAFTATGFTVIKGVNSAIVSTNENNTLYNAYVFSDTITPISKSYLAFGNFTGTGVANGIGGAPWSPTVVWLFGNDGIYRSAPEFGLGDLSVDLAVINNPQTQMIKSLDTLGFTVGTNAGANLNGHAFYWAALRVPAGDPARAFFDTYKFTGTGAPLTVSGVFTPSSPTPGLAVGRIIDSTSPSLWRGLSQTGTHSRSFDGTDSAVNGITALSAGAFTVGSLFTNTHVNYGWALAAGPITVQSPPPGGVVPITGGSVIVQGAAGSGIATGDLGPGGAPCASYS